jgi:hypothetical protein
MDAMSRAPGNESIRRHSEMNGDALAGLDDFERLYDGNAESVLRFSFAGQGPLMWPRI